MLFMMCRHSFCNDFQYNSIQYSNQVLLNKGRNNNFILKIASLLFFTFNFPQIFHLLLPNRNYNGKLVNGIFQHLIKSCFVSYFYFECFFLTVQTDG